MMMLKIRRVLIELIAGKSMVILNAKIKGTVEVDKGQPVIMVNTHFEGPKLSDVPYSAVKRRG